MLLLVELYSIVPVWQLCGFTAVRLLRWSAWKFSQALSVL